jgi:hypothetical protein
VKGAGDADYSAEPIRQELPSVKNAATIFKDTIAALEVYLENMLSLKERRQGGYYIDEGETEEDHTREARGGQWHPHPQLVVLIGAYVLQRCVYASERGDDWGSILQLLSKLHPRPSEANRQQLAQYLYGRQRIKNGKLVPEGDGFLNRARQIAALVRGEEGRGTRGGARSAAGSLRVERR